MMSSAANYSAQVSKDVYTDLSSVNAIRTIEDKDEALEKISQQFESMMMRMMLKSMRSANEIFSEGNMLSSYEGDMYQDMMDDQLALNLSKGKGIGLAELMVRQLRSNPVDDEPKLAVDISDYMVQRRYQDVAAIAEKVTTEVEEVSQPFDGSVRKFVEQLYPLAKKAAEELGVDPKVLIAQAALETGWGKKISEGDTMGSSFNFFNIKADQRWQGASVRVQTIEVRQGMAVKEYANFRAYQNPAHSFTDYVDFIKNSQRYEPALASNNSESYVRHLADAGYATDPAYAEKIIRIMGSKDMESIVNEIEVINQ